MVVVGGGAGPPLRALPPAASAASPLAAARHRRATGDLHLPVPHRHRLLGALLLGSGGHLPADAGRAPRCRRSSLAAAARHEPPGERAAPGALHSGFLPHHLRPPRRRSRSRGTCRTAAPTLCHPLPPLQVASLAAVPTASDDPSDYLSPSKRQRLSTGSLLRVESEVSDLVRCVCGGLAAAHLIRMARRGAAVFCALARPPPARSQGRPTCCLPGPSAGRPCSRNALLGEYRGIMNLCRVLPNGLDAKAAVDEAITRCGAIGNLRADIHACKEAVEGAAPGAEEEGERSHTPPAPAFPTAWQPSWRLLSHVP